MAKKNKKEDQNVTTEENPESAKKVAGEAAKDATVTSEEEPSEIEETNKKYNALQDEYTELKDKYLRLFAEFDNYKKRTVKEKLDLMKTAAQDTMSALLPVLDDFDRAKKIADDEKSPETFSEGVLLVYQKLYTILKLKGLEPMETDGEIFDPELHEAITEIPAASEELKGKIADTIEKGYKLKDKIIRHAKVVVGK